MNRIGFPSKLFVRNLCRRLLRILRWKYHGPIPDWYFYRHGGVDAARVTALANASGIRKFEIVLTHCWGGGANMYLDGKIEKAVKNERGVFLVKPNERFFGILNVELLTAADSISFVVRDLSAFHGLVGKCNKIVVNELVLWHLYDKTRSISVDSMERLVKEILLLKTTLTADMLYLVHDYYCLCPSFNLIMPNGRYCNSEKTMSNCIECKPFGRHSKRKSGNTVERWRRCFACLFSNCSEIRTFSQDTKSRINACFANVCPTVVPHELARKIGRKPDISRGGMVIGVFGNIQPQKGAFEVVALGNYLGRIGRNDVKIIVVGNFSGVSSPMPSVMKIYGEYKVEDLPDIIEREGVNIGFMPSIWPETFSYVTHEIMAMGLPVVCFDIGAQRDAVAKYEKGMVAKSMTAEAVWEAIELLYNMERNGRQYS